MSKEVRLKAPFPYFGGKGKVAALIWQRLWADARNYVEPFCGSAAVLLARPGMAERDQMPIETVNDVNGWVCNFWRAVAADPAAVAAAADWPVSELDLHSRGDAIFYGDGWYARRGLQSVEGFVEALRADPDAYDPLVAGWWVWGASCWIGDNWGRAAHNAGKDEAGNAVRVTRAAPMLSNPHGIMSGAGRGQVERRIPAIALSHGGDALARGVRAPGVGGASGVCAFGTVAAQGRGAVARQLPNIALSHGSDAGAMGIRSQVSRNIPNIGLTDGARCGADGPAKTVGSGLELWFARLAARLRQVRVVCGSWERVCTPCVIDSGSGHTAIFFDPPYGGSGGGRDSVYGEHESFHVAAEVRAWCLAQGGNKRLRICLAGYAGEGHEELSRAGWTCHTWAAGGGFGNQRKVKEGEEKNANRKRETLWFSPHCVGAEQGDLFGHGEAGEAAGGQEHE